MFRNVFFNYKGASNQSGIGGLGEDCAAKFLRNKGYKIIERNWYNTKGKRLGEIDIIAKQNKTIVFVEVKSRNITLKQDPSTIRPQENITASKLHKLERTSQLYISQNNLWNVPWRIDALSVIFRKGLEPKIDHIEGIFL